MKKKPRSAGKQTGEKLRGNLAGRTEFSGISAPGNEGRMEWIY